MQGVVATTENRRFCIPRETGDSSINANVRCYMGTDVVKIVHEKTERFGRFTFVQVTGEDGRIGVGISQRSKQDRIDDNIGYKIARNRAEEALKRKTTGKKITHHYMG